MLVFALGSVGSKPGVALPIAAQGRPSRIAAWSPRKVKPVISPELLDQIDVRVGTIESVNDVANSDKLLALRVNFGDHMRTVVAGMKREWVNPREVEGKQALFVVNLPPRKMAGMSEAMLFDIGYADGRNLLLSYIIKSKSTA